MPRRAAKQCVPRNEVRLNNIAGPVSTPVLNFLRVVEDAQKDYSKTARYAARVGELPGLCRWLF